MGKLNIKKITKDEVITQLQAKAPYMLIKADTGTGGGVLKVNSDKTFDQVMLRTSRNYVDDYFGDGTASITASQALHNSIMTYFAFDIDAFKDNFTGVIFVLKSMEEDTIYPLIFSRAEIMRLYDAYDLYGVKNIRLYLNKVRSGCEHKFVLTRFNVKFDEPIDVSNAYLNWDAL